MNTKERLLGLKQSVEAAGNAYQPSERTNPEYVKGLRDGWLGAASAIAQELRNMEVGEERERIQAQYRKATEPYSGTLRIDATPEELVERQRMIDNGLIPF